MCHFWVLESREIYVDNTGSHRKKSSFITNDDKFDDISIVMNSVKIRTNFLLHKCFLLSKFMEQFFHRCPLYLCCPLKFRYCFL